MANVLLSLFASVCLGAVQAPLTNLVVIETCRHDLSFTNRLFTVRAPVIARLDADDGMLILGDTNGVAEFKHVRKPSEPQLVRGDVVEISGHLVPTRNDILHAVCQRLDLVGHVPPPTPQAITAHEFLSGQFDYKLTEINGIVKDGFQDELDPKYTFLVLQSEEETLYVACRHYLNLYKNHHAHIGKKIAIEGMPQLGNTVNRLHLGRYFYSTDPSRIRTTQASPADSDSIPDLKDVLSLRPQEISRLGRHKAEGSVLAVMHDNSVLIKTYSGLVVKVDIGDATAPRPGQSIVTIGFPESNLYHLDLIRANWEPILATVHSPSSPLDITPENVSFFAQGHRVIDSRYHGKLIRLTGKVMNVPDLENSDGLLRLECDNRIVSVDVASLNHLPEELQRGCAIAVTGVCVLDFEAWRPNSAFPHIRGFFVVPRNASDIRIIAQVSWWTPRRLFVLVCILLPIILASLAINLVLRRLVERRSRALLKEQSAKLAEVLRVDERTRLAAELHDSVAQDLTGISMQIETAEDLAAESPEKLRRILGTASRSLLNCREELRNCLWDLRNHALDELNMDAAIRRTLKPHLDGIELALRFNVPRAIVSDATAHATLQIIRELTTNAIRHGHATRLIVCGAIEDKRLVFSVADNGCGFDAETVPGVSEGHFGLAGIRERLRKLGGEITVQTSPGTGAKFTVKI